MKQATIGQKHLAQFKESARVLVKKHGHLRANGAIASLRTQQVTMDVVMASCERLWVLGFQIREIQSLRPEHIEALVRDWRANEFALKTIQNNLSRLRRVAHWLKKPSIVPDRLLERMYPNESLESLRVQKIAKNSKSWSEQGIDVMAKIKEADDLDERFGAMLRLGLAFGLRRKEQLRAKPKSMDGGTVLFIRGNMAKSGRDRNVPIEHPFQRVCLEHAKRVAGKDEHLGWTDRTYEQSVSRYKYLMSRLGISDSDTGCVGHGLRAEYAENIALLNGLVPPVLGGKADQMDEQARTAIENTVSRNMGHNRAEVTGAYYGSFRQKP